MDKSSGRACLSRESGGFDVGNVGGFLFVKVVKSLRLGV